MFSFASCFISGNYRTRLKRLKEVFSDSFQDLVIVKAVEEFLHVPTHESFKKLLVKRYINNPSEDCGSTHPIGFH